MKQKLDALRKMFSAQDCAKPGKAGLSVRNDLLQRLRAGSPPLVPTAELQWPKVREAYAAQVLKIHKAGIGVMMVREVDVVLQALGRHFGGPTKWSKQDGNPNAFNEYFAKIQKLIPFPATSVSI